MSRYDDWRWGAVIAVLLCIASGIIGAGLGAAYLSDRQADNRASVTPEKPTLSSSLERARTACREAWQSMEGVQVPRHSELGP